MQCFRTFVLSYLPFEGLSLSSSRVLSRIDTTRCVSRLTSHRFLPTSISTILSHFKHIRHQAQLLQAVCLRCKRYLIAYANQVSLPVI